MIEEKTLINQSEIITQKQIFIHVIGYSMYPTLKDGDWIPINIVKRGMPLDLGVIIAYQKNNEIFIHRIIKRFSVLGCYLYLTKGDNNKKRDKYLVNCKEVIGVASLLEYSDKCY